MDQNNADANAAAQVDQLCDETLALIPLAKEAAPLLEIATLLGLDADAEAGNMRALKRKLLNHMNTDAFDAMADRGVD